MVEKREPTLPIIVAERHEERLTLALGRSTGCASLASSPASVSISSPGSVDSSSSDPRWELKFWNVPNIGTIHVVWDA
jgi:hypothetical protein